VNIELRIWRILNIGEKERRTEPGTQETWENWDYFGELVNLPGTLIYLEAEKRKEQSLLNVCDFRPVEPKARLPKGIGRPAASPVWAQPNPD
jgi:hypothetical protein